MRPLETRIFKEDSEGMVLYKLGPTNSHINTDFTNTMQCEMNAVKLNSLLFIIACQNAVIVLIHVELRRLETGNELPY